MYFQLQPLSRLMSSSFSVRSDRFMYRLLALVMPGHSSLPYADCVNLSATPGIQVFHFLLLTKTSMAGTDRTMTPVLIPRAVGRTPMRSPIRICRSAPPARCADRDRAHRPQKSCCG